MELKSIKEVLSHSNEIPETWFYLPPEVNYWELNTEGVFSLDSSDFPPDSDDYLPEQAKCDGWVVTLDGATIQDIVENAKDQLDDTSLDDLFKAFVFYYQNDAFMEF